MKPKTSWMPVDISKMPLGIQILFKQRDGIYVTVGVVCEDDGERWIIDQSGSEIEIGNHLYWCEVPR